MPNQRAPGQKLIPVPMDQKFIDEMDRAVKKSRSANRSDYIRQAIAEKLRSEGYDIPEEWISAPSRLGKGGRYPEHRRPRNLFLNEKGKLSSRVADALQKAEDELQSSLPPGRGRRAPKPSSPAGARGAQKPQPAPGTRGHSSDQRSSPGEVPKSRADAEGGKGHNK